MIVDYIVIQFIVLHLIIIDFIFMHLYFITFHYFFIQFRNQIFFIKINSTLRVYIFFLYRIVMNLRLRYWMLYININTLVHLT